MADQKISELSALLGADAEYTADFLPIVDNSAGTNKRITISELMASTSGVALNDELRIGTGSTADAQLRSGTAGVTTGGTTTAVILSTYTTVGQTGYQVGVEVPANDSNDGFYVATDANKDGTVDNLALRIIANGNVGLGGITAPTEVLDVDGNIAATGTITIGSSANFNGSNLTFTGSQVDIGDTAASTNFDINALSTGEGRIRFYDGTGLEATIKYDFNADELEFLGQGTNTQMGYFDSSGNFFLNGDITIAGDANVTGVVNAPLSPTNITASGWLDIGGDIFNNDDTSVLTIWGGTTGASAGDGAHIALYGATEATNPDALFIDADDFRLRPQAGGSNWAQIDATSADWTIPVTSTGNIETEGAFTYNSPADANATVFALKNASAGDIGRLDISNVTGRSDWTFDGGIKSVTWDLNNGLAGYLNEPEFRINGQLLVEGAVTSGVGTGGVALTANDGYGETNVAFNHAGGTPEVSGNSARFKFNGDTPGSAVMELRMASNVTSGVALALDPVVKWSLSTQRYYIADVETFRMDATGFGAGTTAPAARIHASDSAELVGLFESTDATVQIGLKDNTTTSNTHVGLKATGDVLYLRAADSDQVTINSTGLGIGVTPTEALHVSGDVLIDGGGATSIVMNTSSAVFDPQIIFQDSNTSKWVIGSDTNQSLFYIFDAVNLYSALNVELGAGADAVTIGSTGLILGGINEIARDVTSNSLEISGGTPGDGARIQLKGSTAAIGPDRATFYAGSFRFRDTGDTTTAMSIDGSGNVDILGSYEVDGTQVVTNQQAAIADATDGASAIARLNDLLAALRTHGLIAT